MNIVLMIAVVLVVGAAAALAGWFGGLGRAAAAHSAGLSQAHERERLVGGELARVSAAAAEGQAEILGEIGRLERSHHDEVRSLEREHNAALLALQAELQEVSAASRTEAHLFEALEAKLATSLDQAGERMVKQAEQKYAELEKSAEVVWKEQGTMVAESLGQIRDRVDLVAIERSKESAYMAQTMSALQTMTELGRQETTKLTRALSDNRTRGAWGEVQLRTALESAGLRSGIDFVEQSAAFGEDLSRPDVIVHLPGHRNVVIDAKVPLQRFLDALECEDPAVAKGLFEDHAKVVLTHVQALAKREYADKVTGSVEFVAMFIPKESFLEAAISHRPALVDEARRAGIVFVTPSTLIGLVSLVRLTVREHALSENAQQIFELGRELHERLGKFVGEYAKIGKHLESAVGAFNSATGSLEGRLLPTGRKIETMAASPKLLVDVKEISDHPRAVKSAPATEPIGPLELVIASLADDPEDLDSDDIDEANGRRVG